MHCWTKFADGQAEASWLFISRNVCPSKCSPIPHALQSAVCAALKYAQLLIVTFSCFVFLFCYVEDLPIGNCFLI